MLFPLAPATATATHRRRADQGADDRFRGPLLRLRRSRPATGPRLYTAPRGRRGRAVDGSLAAEDLSRARRTTRLGAPARLHLRRRLSQLRVGTPAVPFPGATPPPAGARAVVRARCGHRHRRPCVLGSADATRLGASRRTPARARLVCIAADARPGPASQGHSQRSRHQKCRRAAVRRTLRGHAALDTKLLRLRRPRLLRERRGHGPLRHAAATRLSALLRPLHARSVHARVPAGSGAPDAHVRRRRGRPRCRHLRELRYVPLRQPRRSAHLRLRAIPQPERRCRRPRAARGRGLAKGANRRSACAAHLPCAVAPVWLDRRHRPVGRPARHRPCAHPAKRRLGLPESGPRDPHRPPSAAKRLASSASGPSPHRSSPPDSRWTNWRACAKRTASHCSTSIQSRSPCACSSGDAANRKQPSTPSSHTTRTRSGVRHSPSGHPCPTDTPPPESRTTPRTARRVSPTRRGCRPRPPSRRPSPR